MRTILVTGANRGIGYELARRYFDMGERVIAACRDPDKATGLNRLVSAKPTAIAIERLDMTSPESIAKLADRLAKRVDRLDALISNAGVNYPESLGSWTFERFSETFATNVTGPAILAQACLPFLKSGSKVINVSSRIGSFGEGVALEGPGDSYAMSKAALNQLTRRLSSKLSGCGVTVVSVSPGWVKTDMGGAKADLQPAKAAKDLVKAIDALTLKQSGSFIGADGKPIPW